MIVLVPPLALIFLVLGTIFVGIATPTEGGAMGAAGALLLAMAKGGSASGPAEAGDGLDREAVGLRALHPDRRARVLADLLWRQRPQMGRASADLAAGRPVGFLIFVNVLVFVLAFFLDFLRARLHHRAAAGAGGGEARHRPDLVRRDPRREHADEFMHPPFGFALFYLRSVAPKEDYIDKVTGKLMEPVTTGQIYWGAMPFVVIQVIMVGLVIAFPRW
jgi:TRAP-type C4-dicarboxylate transport system permease large subunit